MYIQPNTFGKSKICVVLADMINTGNFSDYERHKILSFINHFTNTFKQVSEIKDRTIKEYVLSVVKNDFISKIDIMHYDKKFRTHLQNVMTMYFRKYLK